MNFVADGTKTIYKRGLSKDIMNAIKLAYDNNVDDCVDFARQFKRNSKRETCNELFNVLVSRIRYKVDPDGEQWIRTPARFWNDKEGDCKSYSLFVCCMLSCLGIKNKFRFVDYGNGDYTHVYVIAEDDNGNDVCVDAVAGATRGIDFDSELKFEKKIDMENRKKTDISFLSGLDTSDLGLNTKANLSLLKSYKFLFETYAGEGIDVSVYEPQIAMWDGVISLVERYGNSDSDLQTVGYVLATYVDAETKLFNSVEWGVIRNEIDALVQNSQKEGNFVLSQSFKNANKDFLAWWNKNVIGLNYLNSLNNTPALNDETAIAIMDTCFAYLYVVCDVKLSKKATQKKKKQDALLKKLISKSTLPYEAALNFATIGIIEKTKETPNSVVFSLTKTKIGAWTDTTGEVVDQAGKLSDILQKWFGSDDSSETSKVVIMPSSSDWTSSSNLLLFGALGLVAVLLLTKKGKNEKK